MADTSRYKRLLEKIMEEPPDDILIKRLTEGLPKTIGQMHVLQSAMKSSELICFHFGGQPCVGLAWRMRPHLQAKHSPVEAPGCWLPVTRYGVDITWNAIWDDDIVIDIFPAVTALDEMDELDVVAGHAQDLSGRICEALGLQYEIQPVKIIPFHFNPGWR